jgi:hypothetical protein
MPNINILKKAASSYSRFLSSGLVYETITSDFYAKWVDDFICFVLSIISILMWTTIYDCMGINSIFLS